MVLATLKQTITDWEVTNTPRLLLGHIYLWCSQLGWSDYSVPLSCRAERDICIWVSRICRPVVVSRRVIYGRASVSTVRHFYRRIMDWSASSVMCPTIASHARTLSLSVRERQRHDTGQKRRVGWTNNLQFTRENSAAAHAAKPVSLGSVRSPAVSRIHAAASLSASRCRYGILIVQWRVALLHASVDRWCCCCCCCCCQLPILMQMSEHPHLGLNCRWNVRDCLSRTFQLFRAWSLVWVQYGLILNLANTYVYSPWR